MQMQVYDGILGSTIECSVFVFQIQFYLYVS
jgi:hypothetical protein